MYRLREVERGRYDDRGYSNEQSLAALMIQKTGGNQQLPNLHLWYGR